MNLKLMGAHFSITDSFPILVAFTALFSSRERLSTKALEMNCGLQAMQDSFEESPCEDLLEKILERENLNAAWTATAQ